jgi:DNA-directed RNA polymerase specialized sigma24 family protein
MTGDEAIARLQKKPDDPGAWRFIYTLMQESLRPYVASLLCTFESGPKETSHDIVHEAITGFWGQWAKIRKKIPNEAAAVAYLKVSCRNSLIDKYRRNVSAQPLLDFLTLTFSHTPEDSIIRVLLVQEIVAGISGDCGTLLRSYVNDGLSLAEMADRDGALPSAFYSRWYRCLEKAQAVAESKKPKGFKL